MIQHSIETPTGRFALGEEDGRIVHAGWTDADAPPAPAPTPLLREGADQVRAYFDGRLTRFDLPLTIRAGAFQQAVCAAIADIGYGETATYGTLARTLGVSAQAVGRGCGGNPLPLLVPCHRVLAQSGLGGFSGGTGIETKVWLLRHEGAAGLLI